MFLLRKSSGVTRWFCAAFNDQFTKKILFQNSINSFKEQHKPYIHLLSFPNNTVLEIHPIRTFSMIWNGLYTHKHFAYVIPLHACGWLGMYTDLGRKRYYILQPPISKFTLTQTFVVPPYKVEMKLV